MNPADNQQNGGAQRRQSFAGSEKSTNPPSATLFVGNLPFELREEQVWESFGHYGPISAVRLPTDRETGQPKGYGYVEFVQLEDATKAMEAGGEIEFSGRVPRLDVSPLRSA